MNQNQKDVGNIRNVNLKDPESAQGQDLGEISQETNENEKEDINQDKDINQDTKSMESQPPKEKPLIKTRNGGILYAIAITVLLLGVLIIIIAWAIPTMTLQNSLVFMIPGILLTLIGIFFIVAVPSMF